MGSCVRFAAIIFFALMSCVRVRVCVRSYGRKKHAHANFHIRAPNETFDFSDCAKERDKGKRTHTRAKNSTIKLEARIVCGTSPLYASLHRYDVTLKPKVTTIKFNMNKIPNVASTRTYVSCLFVSYFTVIVVVVGAVVVTVAHKCLCFIFVEIINIVVVFVKFSVHCIHFYSNDDNTIDRFYTRRVFFFSLVRVLFSGRIS